MGHYTPSCLAISKTPYITQNARTPTESNTQDVEEILIKQPHRALALFLVSILYTMEDRYKPDYSRRGYTAIYSNLFALFVVEPLYQYQFNQYQFSLNLDFSFGRIIEIFLKILSDSGANGISGVKCHLRRRWLRSF